MCGEMRRQLVHWSAALAVGAVLIGCSDRPRTDAAGPSTTTTSPVPSASIPASLPASLPESPPGQDTTTSTSVAQPDGSPTGLPGATNPTAVPATTAGGAPATTVAQAPPATTGNGSSSPSTTAPPPAAGNDAVAPSTSQADRATPEQCELLRQLLALVDDARLRDAARQGGCT